MAERPDPCAKSDATTTRDVMDVAQPVTATFQDWLTPCAFAITRPPHLEGRKVQGHKRGGLWCNRPNHHLGPHRVYTDQFHVLVEMPE